MKEAVTGAEIVVSVSPSHVVRDVMREAAPWLREDALVVSASKGIETETLCTMEQVLEQVLPAAAPQRLAVLSGPSFALEVGREQPTAVAVAAHFPAVAARVQELFQTRYFRVYTSSDIRGAEIGGRAEKRDSDRRGGGGPVSDSVTTPRAALITRGLAEITRLGVALGADPLTFAGLAGMGDLILTCTGGLSRNRFVGVQLGKGRSLDEILGEMAEVAEGVRTARAARELARRTGIEMPIVEEVHAILFRARAPREAVERLMLREPKPEQWG